MLLALHKSDFQAKWQACKLYCTSNAVQVEANTGKLIIIIVILSLQLQL